MLTRFCSAVASFLKNDIGPISVETAVLLALTAAICVASIVAISKDANST
jgi:Flp pilus assembly pilin Flp